MVIELPGKTANLLGSLINHLLIMAIILLYVSSTGMEK